MYITRFFENISLKCLITDNLGNFIFKINKKKMNFVRAKMIVLNIYKISFLKTTFQIYFTTGYKSHFFISIFYKLMIER